MPTENEHNLIAYIAGLIAKAEALDIDDPQLCYGVIVNPNLVRPLARLKQMALSYRAHKIMYRHRGARRTPRFCAGSIKFPFLRP